MSELTKEFLQEQYSELNKSTYQIAEENGTYAQKISRLLISYGIPRKTKKKASKNAMKTGRNTHPTRGLKRDKATLAKISESLIARNSALTDEDKEGRAQRARDRWAAMTEGERKEHISARTRGIKEAAKNGSRVENFCVQCLQDAGFYIESHRKDLVTNDKLEVDIYLPEIKTAIEVDGPTHFLPIWGPESLQKHISADNRKNGLLMNSGYKVVRVRLMKRTMNNADYTSLSERLVLTAQGIQNGSITDNLIHIDC